MARVSRKKQNLPTPAVDTPIRRWKTALYVRLSVEDNGKGSDSIENQTTLLEDYVASRSYLEKTALFVDNGYTGTDFLRPEFNRMMEAVKMGVQIGIVIGGGNIFRGLSGSQKGFDRVKGDQMGMCATVINSLALSSALGALGVKNKVLTAIRMEPIGEFYTKWKAIEAMEDGYICIFSAGTGSPYFTTDTGSSLRGIEIEADVMLKGTRVDGIYTADPEKDPTATKFKDITYDEIYTKGLKVMDLTATTMCKENDLPIYVFNMDVVGNLKKVMEGEEIGTLVHN